jgi:hypothetical protein
MEQLVNFIGCSYIFFETTLNKQDSCSDFVEQMRTITNDDNYDIILPTKYLDVEYAYRIN